MVLIFSGIFFKQTKCFSWPVLSYFLVLIVLAIFFWVKFVNMAAGVSFSVTYLNFHSIKRKKLELPSLVLKHPLCKPWVIKYKAN